MILGGGGVTPETFGFRLNWPRLREARRREGSYLLRTNLTASEFFYHTSHSDVGFDPEFPTVVEDFPRIRAKNAINLLALTGPGYGQTPTQWQLSTYPAWAQEKITLLPEGVELATCKPDPAARSALFRIGEWEIGPKDRLVTYVSRDLEPYRGCHIVLRALPRLFQQRRDVRVVMVGGNGVSYGNPPPQGNWRDRFVAELGDRLDSSRVLFPGRIPYSTYLAYPLVTYNH